MFLRVGWISILLSLICINAASAEAGIPGLQKKTYKLKSFTKNFRGKKTEARTGRDHFCGERITPRLIESEGKLIVELNPGLGFEWRNIDRAQTALSDGCQYPIQQTIESAAERSVLVLVNSEDCGNRKPVVGSQRDTVQFNGSQIIYTSESVVKNRAGLWDVNEAKESFTCHWSAD